MNPGKALSVTLDVGTDNEDLLKDPLYVVSSRHSALHTSRLIQALKGWPEKRVRGEKYDQFMDK